MKRVGYLYEQIMTADNVRKAWENYNAHRPICRRVDFDEARAARILERMMCDFAGVIGRPRIKFIRESGKLRRLQIPSFESCIAQLALWNVCGPFVERHIHDNSYSSRKGKGGHALVRKVQRFVHTKGETEARYCLYFDISKYYAHIDKRIMIARLRNIFKDERVIELFAAVIASTDQGLSIGYPFSHALANLYLTPLYYLVSSARNISRVWVYMDNWLIFSRFKAPLKRALKSARAYLRALGCTIKGDWQIFPTSSRAVKVCGVRVMAGAADLLYRRLWRRTVRNFARLVRGLGEAELLGMRSRLGWLDLINRRFAPIFNYKGEYLWK